MGKTTHSDQASHSIISGTLDIKLVLTFVFGVVFIASILVYAAFVKNPGPFAQQVFIVVLALAGAAVAALIPGILHVELPFLRASGALAVFAVVFFFQPKILEKVSTFEVPAAPSAPAALEFMARVDANDIDGAWELLDSEAKETVAKDKATFHSVFAAARAPFGKAIRREQVGMQRLTSPAGYPLGVYDGLNFRAEFSDGLCRQEQVYLRAADGRAWRVFTYNIGMSPIPCR